MMKNFVMTVVLSLVFGTAGKAEFIQNGNFSRGVANWDLAAPGVYGPPPSAQVKDGALELSKLHSTSTGYLTLNQALDIGSNQHYRLTFEARGDSDRKFLVAIHDPGEMGHVSRLFTPEASWKTYEVEFTGLYDTDSRWVRQWLKATRKNILQDGQTINSSLHEVDDPEAEGPIRSYLTIALGELSGTFALRNLSLVEVLNKQPAGAGIRR